MSSRGCANYGRFYWCIGVSTEVCETGRIYVHGDRIETTPAGVLMLWRDTELKDTTAERNAQRAPREPLPNIVFAPGQWTYVFAAAVIDGAPVAVEHWKGEVEQ